MDTSNSQPVLWKGREMMSFGQWNLLGTSTLECPDRRIGNETGRGEISVASH